MGIANVHKLRQQLAEAKTDAEILDTYERLHNLMYCVILEFTKQYGNREGEGGRNE